jgi:hypothetical protein
MQLKKPQITWITYSTSMKCPTVIMWVLEFLVVKVMWVPASTRLVEFHEWRSWGGLQVKMGA